MENHPNQNTPEAIALHNKRIETPSTRESRLEDELHLNKYFKAEQKVHTDLEIKKRKEAELELKRLEALAMTDTLTGLLNRRAWDSEVDKLIAEYNRHPEEHRQEYALLTLDIDFFKKINDTYGHEGGDEVLKETATVLKRIFRETDIISRFGGEEFFVLIKDTHVEEVIERLSQGRNTKEPGISFEVTIGDAVELVNFSGGLTSLTPTSKDVVKEAMTTVDSYLYQAKASGRNHIVTEQ